MKNIIHATAIMLQLIAITSSGQNLQKEINDQVWKPQSEAMHHNDSEKFMSVMSKDVVQVSYERKVVRNHADFAKEVEATYKRIKDRNLVRNMEFRFLERTASGNLAFEDGFLKYELLNEKAEKRIFYGYFQVVLRKESNSWKVLVDYNADNYQGQPVTAGQFEKARGLDSYDQ